MDGKKLPTRLGKEPLIDAIFELRFNSSAPASNILPGALYAHLGSGGRNVIVQRLPVAQIPEEIRRTDLNLQYAPIIKMDCDQYAVLISDGSILVSCKLPYRGWQFFRQTIGEIVKEVEKVGLVNSIVRYSVKYVDIIPYSDLRKQVGGLEWNVQVGGHQLSAEIASVRVEIPRRDFLHIVSIQTGAVVEIQGRPRVEGVIVDVDTICRVNETPFATFLSEMPSRLEEIHAENKEVFFDCLTPETLMELEPVYE